MTKNNIIKLSATLYEYSSNIDARIYINGNHFNKPLSELSDKELVQIKNILVSLDASVEEEATRRFGKQRRTALPAKSRKGAKKAAGAAKEQKAGNNTDKAEKND